MNKNPDWNEALSYNEDNNALNSSEVFCNYVKIVEAKDKFLVPLNLSTSTLISQDYVNAAKEERDSFEPASREWRAFNSFVKKLQERLARQEELDRPAKVMASLTVPESTDFDYSSLFKNAEDEMAEELVKDAPEPEEPEEKEETEPKSEKTEKAKPSNSSECNYKELYETGAGDSKFLDIGLTSETEKLMENGIDYMDSASTSTPSVPKKETIKEETKTEEPKEEEQEEKDEIVEAEKALGLDLNIFYILRKMGK